MEVEFLSVIYILRFLLLKQQLVLSKVIIILGQIGFWIIDTVLVGVKEEDLSQKLPLKTELLSPLPNPFIRKTLISYSLSKEVDVAIIIYNPLGQIVKQISIKKQKPGIYSFTFSPKKIIKGIYFLKFKAGDYNKKDYFYSLKFIIDFYFYLI